MRNPFKGIGQKVRKRTVGLTPLEEYRERTLNLHKKVAAIQGLTQPPEEVPTEQELQNAKKWRHLQ